MVDGKPERETDDHLTIKCEKSQTLTSTIDHHFHCGKCYCTAIAMWESVRICGICQICRRTMMQVCRTVADW